MIGNILNIILIAGINKSAVRQIQIRDIGAYNDNGDILADKAVCYELSQFFVDKGL